VGFPGETEEDFSYLLQWLEEARAMAAGLRTLGVERGDRVAILSRTQVEWVIADLACAIAGAVSVPIYPSLAARDIAYILADSGASVAFVDEASRIEGSADVLEARARARDAEDERPDPTESVRLRHVVVFDPRRRRSQDGDSAASSSSLSSSVLSSPADWVPCTPWQTLLEAGRASLAAADGKAEATLTEMEADLGISDPVTLVYTSGTTGEPKGAILTHGNLVYESWAIRNVVPVDHTDEQLMLLPLAHIFARHLVWGAVEQGAITAFAESDERLAANLQELAPTFIGGVPRMYEQLYAQMRDEAESRGGLSKAMLTYALDTGRRVSVCKQRGQPVSRSLALKMVVADRILFRRIHGFFGGRLRYLVCGGAPLSREVAEFFHAAGILLLEGYGLSETTGATIVNRPDRFRFGTVGPAMPGCEVRVAEDGEILVRGHNVMAGYHGRPEETAAAFDEQGWLRTGDLGELSDGFLRITGRKKDVFKITTGKYVAPLMIEKRLRVREGIAHAVVCGEGRPYAVALVSLDERRLLEISDREGLGCRAYADLVVHPRIKQIVQRSVEDVNDALARHERVRRFAIVPRPMTQETGELTPTRKVKRRVMSAKYAALVASLYDEATARKQPFA
ncbi:MAG: AMP-binding protein, partial [Nannocystaceae bacterium]|nr:AMP-binding protein [Nannocystaceae bacterium]